MTVTSQSGFRWEQPPPDGRTVRTVRQSEDAYKEIADQLRANPGEWARIMVKSTSGGAGNFATTVKNGALAAFRPKNSFEAVSRMIRDEKTREPVLDDVGRKQYGVWARFVGEDES